MMQAARACAFILPLLLGSPSLAENTSAYTKLDLKACTEIDPSVADEGYGGQLICPGYGTLKVFWSEGDLRSFVAFGESPKTHCAARQTFNAFNSERETIEWRLKDGKPIAVIQRWAVNSDTEVPEKIKTWLVVTKLEPNNSCHMAFVEGALPDANVKARLAADQNSGSFQCAIGKPEVISAAPVPPEMVSTGPCNRP
jgi:hypothetical protein